jgi:hypothetical protein
MTSRLHYLLKLQGRQTGNLKVEHIPNDPKTITKWDVHKGEWYTIDLCPPYFDEYIHKNNIHKNITDSVAPEGKTYFSTRLQKWVNFGEVNWDDTYFIFGQDD